MSLLGALLRPPANKGQTPIPLTSRASAGTWGNRFTRLSGAEQQLSAMEAIGIVFGIVDRIATSVSLVDWHLYKQAKSGKKEERTVVTSHLAWEIWNRPNPFFTRQELVETCQQHQELIGEQWCVVGKSPLADLPLELWPVRPDRMDPIPDPKLFLAGYVYTSPDGERVPLATKDVLFARRPDPKSPYRGIGPIKPALTDIDSTRFAAEWNRNFFLNSAEPGGIIQIDRRLSDDEFDELRKRWAEQHQGVSAAHRVAILEQVQWVDRKLTQRDMQFAELRGVTEDAIRKAFGFPKFMLGDVDDVNRANAEASEAAFAQWTLVPRLERWKQLLNNDFLPLFGTSASGLEFDYENPVPANSEAENAARTSKVQAVATLVPLGADFADAMEKFDLPALKYEKPAPPPALPGGGGMPAGAPGRAPGVPAGGAQGAWAQLTAGLYNAAPDPDMMLVQQDFETALNGLLAQWPQVTGQQQAELRAQVAEIVDSGQLEALATMGVDTTEGEEILAAALAVFAAIAGGRMASELAAQGVAAAVVVPPAEAFTTVAAAVAGVLGGGLVQAAAAEAVRLAAPGASGTAVSAAVGLFLEGLSDRAPRDQFSSVLTRTQNESRLLTAGGVDGIDPNDPAGTDLLDVPQIIYYASEVNDSNTCRKKNPADVDRCHEIDGHEFESWKAAWDAYAGGTYKHCLGRWRCRGTVKAKWNPAAGEL